MGDEADVPPRGSSGIHGRRPAGTIVTRKAAPRAAHLNVHKHDLAYLRT